LKIRLSDSYHRRMEKFLDGPDWYQLQSLERRRGAYRAPSLALLAWVAGFIWRSLTLQSLLLLLPGALIFLYSTISMESPIRVTTIAILMVMVVELLAGYIFRPKLKIERSLPERLRVGSEFTVDYRITNRRRIPAWDIELDAYMLRKGVKITETAFVNAIGAGKTVRASARGIAVRRGVYRIFSPIADSLFPLAIAKWSCSEKTLKQTVHVYPAFTALNHLALPTGGKFQKNGTSRVSKVGESADFYGCREFRDGDDPRHIYWRGSARTGQLIVKEFQNEYLTRIALVVDTYVPSRRRWYSLKSSAYSPELEGGLSLAAAITDYLTRGEYVVDIFAAGDKVYHFQAGRHLACFDNILDILAGVHPNSDPAVSELSDSVMDEISGIGSAVIVLLGWDAGRARMIERFREAGVSLKVMIINAPPKAPEYLIRLRTEDIETGNIRDL